MASSAARLTAERLAIISAVVIVAAWFGVVAYGFDWFVYDDRPAEQPAAALAEPREQPHGLRRVPRSQLQDRGQFGDMFGVFGSLLAGLSLVGVAYTLHLQREQLRKQQQEYHLLRFEAEDDKLAEIAENFLRPSNDDDLYHTQVMLEAFVPIINEGFGDTEWFQRELAAKVLEEVEIHLRRGLTYPRDEYLRLMERFLVQTTNAVTASGVDPKSLGDAYSQSLKGFARERRLLLSLRNTLFVYTSYARVWFSRERERKAAGVAVATDYLEMHSRRWGQALAALVLRVMGPTPEAVVHGRVLRVVVDYLVSAGHGTIVPAKVQK